MKHPAKAALFPFLKPGGQMLFFEANFWNPQGLVKNVIPAIGRWAGQASCQIGLRRYRLIDRVIDHLFARSRGFFPNRGEEVVQLFQPRAALTAFGHTHRPHVQFAVDERHL